MIEAGKNQSKVHFEKLILGPLLQLLIGRLYYDQSTVLASSRLQSEWKKLLYSPAC